MKIPSTLPRLKGFRFPREVIAYAVWAYYRFALSTGERLQQYNSGSTQCLHNSFLRLTNNHDDCGLTKSRTKISILFC